MSQDERTRIQHKLACVQFIAEVSLVANCKPSELELALSLIADLASTETQENREDVFYESD